MEGLFLLAMDHVARRLQVISASELTEDFSRKGAKTQNAKTFEFEALYAFCAIAPLRVKTFCLGPILHARFSVFL